MTSKRLFIVLCVLLVLLAGIGISGTVLGNAMLKRKAQSIIDLKLESAALDDQQKSLIQAKKDIASYQELEQIAKSIVPQEKDQARAVREIISIADESNVPIASITFPASTLGQTPSRPTAPAPGSNTTPTTESTATQVVPVEGIPGVYQLAINVQSATSPVRYQDMLNFLSRLQQNRRTSHITNLSVTPSRTNRNTVTFSLVINAYIKP